MRIHINAEINLEEAIERIHKDGSPLFILDCNEIDITVTAFNVPDSNTDELNRLRDMAARRERTVFDLEERIRSLQEELRRAQDAARPKLDIITDAQQLRNAIKEDLRLGNKINAIKTVREMTGFGLKEAKDFVDATVAAAGHQVGANTNLATPVNILDTIVKEF